MAVETIVLIVGLLLVVGVCAGGLRKALRLEREHGPSRIPLVTATRLLDWLGLPLSVVLIVVFAVTCAQPHPKAEDWFLPVLALLVLLQRGFPMGAVWKPGLTDAGLVHLGTLYPWDYFDRFGDQRTNSLCLSYRKPVLGLGKIRLRFRDEDMPAVLTRLAEKGLEG